jgi:hypothetical protein
MENRWTLNWREIAAACLAAALLVLISRATFQTYLAIDTIAADAAAWGAAHMAPR